MIFWPPTIRFMNNKIFLNKHSQKLAAQIFTLLLAPFAFKLVNHSIHSEILNFHKISKSTSFSFKISDFAKFKHISKTHCVSKKWPILTQNMPKEVQRCELPISVSVFPKIFCCSWMVGGQKIVHYRVGTWNFSLKAYISKWNIYGKGVVWFKLWACYLIADIIS